MFRALKEKIFKSNGISKESAKSRLHFVLVQDRTGLSAERLAGFRKDMVDVIQKYFVIDESGFDIAYKRDTGVTTLIINSPIVVRREEAIHGMVGSEMSQKAAINSETPN
ncbi:MAG: cell division topological specificity factor MinE [SAR324 cluster bacterium]|uniref:Cell division topological specificity factor MinE n=1 Tax=SAR324 cluster bacterium TaxID=2024889 RepID=A0A7X9IL49_9DELT|nr:cell division topological specificity factor MinE [SAR324 cluster bacterium]